MRKHLKIRTLMSGAALVAALFVFSGDALAQSSRDLSNRLSRLENEMQTLSRAIYKGETPPAGSFGGSGGDAAGAEVRFQQLEIQIRELTGKMEEQSYQIRQLQEQMERMSGDIDMRLGDLERGGAAGGSSSGSFSVNSGSTSDSPSSYQDTPPVYNRSDSSISDPSDPASSDTRSNTLGTLSYDVGTGGVTGSSDATGASGVYENAFSLLKNGNYDSAERQFESFLRDNKDHPLAGNAKYWLGETYYVRGDFERAARVFAEGYQQYPDSPKTADNLLKLGLSLASTGNTKDACIALKQLQKDFSNGVGPVLRRAEQEISRLGC